MLKNKQKNNQKAHPGFQSLEYITLAEAASDCAYSQDYLSLRARQGKLQAVKKGRNWVTTKEWLWEYIHATSHGYKKDESLELTLGRNIATKQLHFSVGTYYEFKKSIIFAISKLVSLFSKALFFLMRMSAFLVVYPGKYLVRFSEVILRHLNVTLWMLPKRLETIRARRFSSYFSFVMIVLIVLWSTNIHALVIDQMVGDVRDIGVSVSQRFDNETFLGSKARLISSKISHYTGRQFDSLKSFYLIVARQGFTYQNLALHGDMINSVEGSVLGVSENKDSDIQNNNYGRLAKLNSIFTEDSDFSLAMDAMNYEDSLDYTHEVNTWGVAKFFRSLNKFQNFLSRSFEKFPGLKINNIGTAFNILHMMGDVVVRPLVVARNIPTKLNSSTYLAVRKAFNKYFDSTSTIANNDLDVITDYELEEQTIASKFDSLYLGSSGEVVNFNTAETYNFSKLATVQNDLLIQPASGYMVKIGKGEVRHLSEQRLFDNDISGDRSLLVTGMLEVQKSAFIDVSSREAALVLRQNGSGNLITAYNGTGDQVFSVSKDGIVSAKGFSPSIATTQIFQSQDPIGDSPILDNLTVRNSADIGSLTVRGDITTDGLTTLNKAIINSLDVTSDLTLDNSLDVLGDVALGVDALVVDVVNKVVTTGELNVRENTTIEKSLKVNGNTIIDGDLIVNGSIIGLPSYSSGSSGSVNNITNYINSFDDHVSFADANVSGLLGVGYLGVGQTASFASDVTIGNETSDVLTVNSITNFNAPVTIIGNNSLTVGGTLTANNFTITGASTFVTSTFDGVISLLETVAPSATANYGKIYTKASDSGLYFLDDGGTEYDLLTGGGGSSSSFWATTTDDLVLKPVDAGHVVVVGASATTTTGYQFEVVGSSLFDNITVGGQLTLEGTGTSTIAGDISFDSGVLYIDSLNNKVGFGTTSPLVLLTVGSSTPDKIASFNRYNSAFVAGDLEVDGTLYADGGITTTNVTSTNVTTTNLAVIGQATISGGTIDNTVIGGSTPSSGTFTTITANISASTTDLVVSDTATTTNLYVDNIATFNNSIVLNTDTITDFTGTGLIVSGSSLQTTLGTSVDLTSEVTGVLSIANGGTNLSSAPTYGQLLVGNASGGYTQSATSTLGIALSDTTGTLAVNRGGTGATTFASNGILFGNGTGALQVTSSAANSILLTNGSSVPSLSQTLPTTVQGNITSLGTIASGVWNGTSITDAYIDDTITASNYLALSDWFATTTAPQLTTLSNLSTVGTITSGTWQGSAINPTYLDPSVIISTEIDTSAKLAAIVTDETGSGALVFGTSPTLGTPTISGGTIDNTVIGGSTSAAGTFTTITVNTSASTTDLVVSDTATTTNLYVNGTATIAGNLNPQFTTGSVAFQGVNGLTQDNANFFWDNTNNRLGIGVASPITTFDVGGNFSVTSAGVVSASSTIYSYSDITSATRIVAESTSATSTFAAGLTVETSGLVYDYSTNNVGIGTASPIATLTVEGTAAGSKTVLLKAASSQTADILTIQNAGADDLLTIDNDGKTVWSVSTSTAAVVINQNGSGNIIEFQYQSSTVFTVGPTQVTSEVPFAVNSTGDTGIAGTLQFTNPTASYIKSDSPLYITAGDLASNEDLTLKANNEGWVIVDDNLLVQASSTNAVARINSIGGVASGNILEIEDNGTDVVVVDSAGKVGIGTSSPLTTLAVQGIAGTEILEIASSTGASLLNIDELGAFSVGSTVTSTFAGAIDVNGTATSTFAGAIQVGNAYTLPSNDGTANYVLKTDGSGAVTWQADSTGSAVSDWSFDNTYGVSVLTPSSTIPIWAKDTIYASSTLIVDGQSTFGNVSSTILTVSGSSYLGTVVQGTWNGSLIDQAYLDTNVVLDTEIDTYAELNTIVADVTLTHNGLIDTYTELNSIVADVTLTNNSLIDTSAELAGIVGDETGSGALVFGTSPVFTTQITAPQIVTSASNLALQPSTGIVDINTNATQNYLRVYDSAGTDYIQLTHDGTNAAITTNVGNVNIGTAGNDVLIGAVGTASNLVFEESSTISGQGGNTITVGVNGDTINLGVTGVTYKVRDLVASTTNLTIDVNNTATTTVVFENKTTNTGYNELVNLAVEGAASFGATTSTEYNRFGLGTPGQSAIVDANDVFISGDIEVDGTAYLSGGTAWTSGDFAEEMSVYEDDAEPGDVIVLNREFGISGSSELYIGRLSFESNSNAILGVVTTDPAGILKSGAYDYANGQPVVLTGTTPVKVTDEAGLVRRGDLLTTSATELGKAMRATSIDAGTLGIALEDDDGSGLVSALLSIKNNVSFDSYKNEDIILPISTSTAITTDDLINTSTSTEDIINDEDDSIVVIDDVNDNTSVVVIDYEELANISVTGSAEFTGSISVVDAEFTGRLVVLGEIIIAGDLDLSGAITTWFWDDSIFADSIPNNTIQLGDAVAVVGNNSVATMWANVDEFRPVTGIAVAFKPFSSLNEAELESMPAHLKSKYEEIINTDIPVINVASTTVTSTIFIEPNNPNLEQFRMVKVAISGVIKGYKDLIAGNRYFLGINNGIVRDGIIEDADSDFQDVVSTIDDLLEESENLTGEVAGAEEAEEAEFDKFSRTLTYQQPTENGARVQVVGVAKSANEFLIQPSLNYSLFEDGYLRWDFDGEYQTGSSTVVTSTEDVIVEDPVSESEAIYVVPGNGVPVSDGDNVVLENGDNTDNNSSEEVPLVDTTDIITSTSTSSSLENDNVGDSIDTNNTTSTSVTTDDVVEPVVVEDVVEEVMVDEEDVDAPVVEEPVEEVIDEPVAE